MHSARSLSDGSDYLDYHHTADVALDKVDSHRTVIDLLGADAGPGAGCGAIPASDANRTESSALTTRCSSAFPPHTIRRTHLTKPLFYIDFTSH
jgi:hypothetical protein